MQVYELTSCEIYLYIIQYSRSRWTIFSIDISSYPLRFLFIPISVLRSHYPHLLKSIKGTYL